MGDLAKRIQKIEEALGTFESLPQKERFQVIEKFEDDAEEIIKSQELAILADLSRRYGIPEAEMGRKIIFVILRTFCKRPKGEALIPPPGEGEE